MTLTLEEVRELIDAIDTEIRELIMKRLDCSEMVAAAKIASGDLTIYRADRENAILDRLGEGIPEERRAGYLAVVRKIMETSRMYQYGIFFEQCRDLVEPLLRDPKIVSDDPTAEGAQVRLKLSRPDRPNAMSSILSMIGDYGYNMERMELTGYDHSNVNDDGNDNDNNGIPKVHFELTIRGSLAERNMQKLMLQLSMECSDFQIL